MNVMNKLENYFKKYFLEIKKNIDFIDIYQLEKIADLIVRASKSGKKL